MPKEKGKKHKEILKCSRCRLDKQKCLPEGRVWPGAKCNRCQEHGYQCSQPLSARNEKIEREAEEETNVPHSSKSSRRFHDQDDFIPTLSSASASPPPQRPETDDLSAVRNAALAMRLHPPRRSPMTMIREPPAYRIIDSNSARLQERFANFWGSPMTFSSMCSPDFAKMISTLFHVDSQQIALMDDMTSNAVMAFSAGDAALTQSPHWPVFTKMTHSHAMRAMTLLRDRLRSTWPHLNDASVVLTAFNLFCYGLCVSDSSILQFMTAIIQTYHKYNSGFPLNAEIVTGDNGFWIVRLFMANNPEDRGLIMRHDTNTFEREREMFEDRSGFYSSHQKRRGSSPDQPATPILASNVDPVVTLTVSDIAAEVHVPVNPSSPYSSPPSSSPYDTDTMFVDPDERIWDM
ncbi:uncharacterized protein DFL_007519 [Arthrobotrys flagrans]|uniref:Zn(2)-C6 fungal-type domain-containing protein n=1 Tax=Arthrobotrys flagrans TaxID=97331 RepID=A0A436ZVX8_ARTFL|nr:hypothetical protein DFL_007519 [Arthrobotrys flagrans]